MYIFTEIYNDLFKNDFVKHLSFVFCCYFALKTRPNIIQFDEINRASERASSKIKQQKINRRRVVTENKRLQV